MSTSIFMKVLESSPSRYDRGIRLLTLGKDTLIKKKIVNEYLSGGEYVLDIGTGTGTLAILCARKGCKVFAFDKSAKMLAIASKKVKDLGLNNLIHLEDLSVTEMDTHLKDNIFDTVIAALVFSELSEAEQKFALSQCFRVLKPGGRLIIEDEVVPNSLWKRVIHFLIRIPLSIITYIIAQSLTRPVKDLENKLIDAGFEIEEISRFFYDSLILIVAKKEVKKSGAS